MVDESPSAAPIAPRCPWCSAELPREPIENCPSCGAALTGAPDVNGPGLTAIDAEAIVRAARAPAGRGRNRLLGWISGEYPEDEPPAPEGSLAPPPPEVRREMLRLALEAEVASLQAEVTAVETEARIDESAAPAETAAPAQATAEPRPAPPLPPDASPPG